MAAFAPAEDSAMTASTTTQQRAGQSRPATMSSSSSPIPQYAVLHHEASSTSSLSVRRIYTRKKSTSWLLALVLVTLSVSVVDGQLAHNQVIPPGQKRPDLFPSATPSGSSSPASKKQQHSKKKQKPKTTAKKIHPTIDRTKPYVPHHTPNQASLSPTASHAPGALPQTSPSSAWRPNSQSRPSKSSSSQPSESQSDPPKAFAYLEDIGVAPDIPFISGMRPAGQTWNDAGLRPNVDPRLKSPFRKDLTRHGKGAGKKHLNGKDRQSAFAAGSKGDRPESELHPASPDVPPGASRLQGMPIAQGHQSEQVSSGDRPKWELRPERPGSPEPVTSDDDWAAQEHSNDDTLQRGSEASIAASKAGTAAAAAAAAGYDTTPAIFKFKNNIIDSGKQVFQWLKTGGKSKDGIALTMLQPKVHRPVVAHVPLIPNDAKRDFVFLIIASIAGCFMLVFMWSSRVSPEEFQRAKRLKEYAGSHPRSGYGSDVQGDDVVAGASSSRVQATGRRRTVAASTAYRRPTIDDLGIADEESDAEVARAILSRNNAKRNRRISPPMMPPLDDREKNGLIATLRSWFGFGHRRGTKSDGAIALPLLSDLSRSTTPKHPDARDSSDVAAAKRKWSITSMSRSPSSSLLPSSGAFTDGGARPSPGGHPSGSSFLSHSPLRSITPQPQTQRQRERERSRERRRKAEDARWEAEQARIRMGGSLAGPSTSRRGSAVDTGGSARESPYGGELDDFDYFTQRAAYNDVDLDGIESGLPSRAASANSFRSWRGSTNSSTGGSSLGHGVSPWSAIKPLTPREMTQHTLEARSQLAVSDTPYSEITPPVSNSAGVHATSHSATSSLPSVLQPTKAGGTPGQDHFAVPRLAVTNASSPLEGENSGGSTPRASTLRRLAKEGEGFDDEQESTPRIGTITDADGAAFTEKGMGKQRAWS